MMYLATSSSLTRFRCGARKEGDRAGIDRLEKRRRLDDELPGIRRSMLDVRGSAFLRVNLSNRLLLPPNIDDSSDCDSAVTFHIALQSKLWLKGT